MAAIEHGSAATASAKPRALSWGVCASVFFAGSVLLWADRSNFSVAAAAWAKEYNWTPSTIGLMLSAFSLGYLIMQPIGGALADKFGPRKTVATCIAGWSVWVLATPLAPTMLGLTALFRVLLGMFEAPFIPATASAIARAVPAEARRGKFAAFMQSGAQLGPAVGVALAGLILSTTGLPAMIFLLFGGLGLIAAGAWWLYARRLTDPAPAGTQAQTEEATLRAAQRPVPHLKLLTSPALWPFYIGYFALPYCQYIFLAWLPQYLTHYRHIPLVQASILSSLPYIVAFLAVNFTGWAMDWMAQRGMRKGAIHRKLFIVLGALIYAVTTLIAATTDSTSLAVTMIIVANVGLSFYVIPFWTICTDITPTQTGALSGWMNFFGICGATISPYLSGVIAQATGAFVAPLELAVGIMLVAATVIVFFFRVRPLSALVGGTPAPAAEQLTA